MPVDVNGNPAAVAAGELIDSVWGNAVVSRGVKRFPTVAARDAGWPAATAGAGAFATTTDTGTLWTVFGGVWVAVTTPPTPWTVASLVNGWVPSGSPLSYRKVGDIVYLRGGVAAGSSIATILPVGFRPPATVILLFLVQGGLLGYCTVLTNGNVQFNGANTGDDQINAQFSITP